MAYSTEACSKFLKAEHIFNTKHNSEGKWSTYDTVYQSKTFPYQKWHLYSSILVKVDINLLGIILHDTV